VSDAPPAEKKAIFGQCEAISPPNEQGWVTFSINIGKQYPVKLSTKVPAVIEQGRAAGMQASTWHYKESQGNPNPHKPGEFYKNRFFESVEVGVQNTEAVATSNPSASQTPRVEAHHDPLAEADKQRAITRMSCLSSATNLYMGLGLELAATSPDADAVVAILSAAQRFERWVYRDIDEVPSPSGAETPPPADDPPFGGPDDGIPY
jgi:hypothetical protein